MPNISKPSLKDILDNYLESKLYDEISGTWAASLLFRPAGLLCAWLAIRIGASAMALTTLGLFSTLLLAFAPLFMDGQYLMTAAVVQACVFLLLDHTDGQVARSTHSQSKQGAFLDGISDVLWRIVILAVIGHAFDTTNPAPPNAPHVSGLVIGLGAGVAATLARLIRSMTAALAQSPQSGRFALPKTSGEIAFAFLSGLDHVTPFLAQAALLAGIHSGFLWVVLAYHFADLTGVFVHRCFTIGVHTD